MKKLSNKWQLSFLTILIAAGNVYAGTETPTQYTVTLSKVEFRKAGGGSFTTYARGSTQVNIASVGAGQPCGQLQPTGKLTPGNYDQMRFTVSKTMVVKGQSTGTLSNGVTCRTTSSSTLIQDPYGDGSVSEAYLGATDGAAPEAQTVIVPTGSAVTYPSGFASVGNTIQATTPVAMNVAGSVPQGTVSFNVVNAIDFEPYGATQCLVFPVAPSINVSI